MSKLTNYLKHVNLLIIKNNIKELVELTKDDTELVGGSDFADFEEKFASSVNKILKAISEREKGYSKNMGKLNKELKSYVNDMQSFIENRGNDKERVSLFERINYHVNNFKSLIIGDGTGQDLNTVFGEVLNEIPGMGDLTENTGNPVSSLGTEKLKQDGGFFTTPEEAQELDKYLDKKYDQYHNLFEKSNELYRDLKNYKIKGLDQSHELLIENLANLKREEDLELSNLRDIFKILLLSVYKSDQYERFSQMPFEELFLQNEVPFPYGPIECGLGENGLTFQKALDRMQDVTGYCDKHFVSDYALKSHFLKQIHRIIYIKQHLDSEFPKFKLMSGWIVGDNPLKGGADLQEEDKLKEIKLMVEKAVQEQLNEKKNQFKEFVKDEVKDLNVNKEESSLDKMKQSVTNPIEDVHFINPAATLINQKLQKMEGIKDEITERLENKEIDDDNLKTKSSMYKPVPTVLDTAREKTELNQNAEQLEDLFSEYMEENAAIMNSKVRMLNDLQSSVGVVKQRRDFEDSKLTNALSSLEGLAKALNDNQLEEIDDDFEDDE